MLVLKDLGYARSHVRFNFFISKSIFHVMTPKYFIYAGGILFFFILREFIMDGVYSTRYGPDKERFRFSMFLLFVQTGVNCLFAVVSFLIEQMYWAVKDPSKRPKGIDAIFFFFRSFSHSFRN